MRNLRSILEDVFRDADAETAKQLVTQSAGKLGTKGIKVSKLLSKGTKGIAFTTKAGTVLKVTQDRSEANAAQAVKGKSLEHVYKVYDVFQFADSNLFGIHQELCSKYTGPFDFLRLAVVMFPHYREYVQGGMRQNLDAEVEKYVTSEGSRKGTDVKAAMEFMNQISDALTELLSCKVQFDDVHDGNVMQRGSQIVLIDIGNAQAPAAQIPVL